MVVIAKNGKLELMIGIDEYCEHINLYPGEEYSHTWKHMLMSKIDGILL